MGKERFFCFARKNRHDYGLFRTGGPDAEPRPTGLVPPRRTCLAEAWAKADGRGFCTRGPRADRRRNPPSFVRGGGASPTLRLRGDDENMPLGNTGTESGFGEHQEARICSFPLSTGPCLLLHCSRNGNWFSRMIKAKKIALVIVSSLLSICFVEAALRIHSIYKFSEDLADAFEHPDLPRDGLTVTMGAMIRPSPHKEIIYELKPKLKVFFKGAAVRTNSHGWREDEIPTEKSKDTIRIVGIGDSVMFGWGVGERQRYLDIIEKELSSDYPDWKWETLAFAVPGYNLAMETTVLEKYALAYEPDLIIYGFVINDKCLPDFVVSSISFLSARFFILDYLRAAIGQHSAFEIWTDWRSQEQFSVCRPERAPSSYRDLVGQEIFLKHYARLEEIGRRRNIPIIVSVPPSHMLKPHIRRKLGKLRTRFKSIRIIAFDKALAAYLKRGTYSDYSHSPLPISRRDAHPSVSGHRFFAKHLYRKMVQNGTIARILKKKDDLR